MTFAVYRSLIVLTTAFTSTTRPVMVRAMILAHEPRQARVAGEAYVRLTLRAGGIVLIRAITQEDVHDYIILAQQLGYEVDDNYLLGRIIHSTDTEIVYVAELEGKVIGWIDCIITSTYLHEPHCEIAGLVVDENTRSKGIVERLVQTAEHWAKEKGINEITVRSNVKRERAHKFYIRHGYTIVKQSMIFSKKI